PPITTTCVCDFIPAVLPDGLSRRIPPRIPRRVQSAAGMVRGGCVSVSGRAARGPPRPRGRAGRRDVPPPPPCGPGPPDHLGLAKRLKPRPELRADSESRRSAFRATIEQPSLGGPDESLLHRL